MVQQNHTKKNNEMGQEQKGGHLFNLLRQSNNFFNCQFLVSLWPQCSFIVCLIFFICEHEAPASDVAVGFFFLSWLNSLVALGVTLVDWSLPLLHVLSSFASFQFAGQSFQNGFVTLFRLSKLFHDDHWLVKLSFSF